MPTGHSLVSPVSPASIADAIATEVGTVLVGYEHVIDHLTIARLTRGHMLLEGVPGVAKPTIATLFARATGLDSRRLQFKLSSDLPNRNEEETLLDRFDADPELGPDDVETVVIEDDFFRAREVVADVYVADPVRRYLLALVGATRDHADVLHDASPRASITYLDAAKALATVRDRRYVIPDDVKALTKSVLGHRLC